MSNTATAVAEPQTSLHLNLDVEGMKKEIIQTAQVKKFVDPKLEEQAEQFAEMLVNFSSEDFEAQKERTAAIESMGNSLQTQSAHRSRMMDGRVRELSSKANEGSDVANALLQLQEKVSELDPSGMNFSIGWFAQLFGWVPFVGTPMKRYFMEYQTGQEVIDAILKSLENGKAQLLRDNGILGEDQRLMRDLTHKLVRQIEMGQILDTKLEYRLSNEMDDERKRFIQDELLFPLRQRIADLQQQLVTNQQGVLSTELIIRNNKELVRGVNRAMSVTVSALSVAVQIAYALAHQKITLDKIEALNKTTNQMLASNAQRLKQQGVEIHKRASTASLDMDVLAGSMKDILDAMDEISAYRREALPGMAAEILKFNELTNQGEQAIERMEDGNRADVSGMISLDLDEAA